jgi:hypothetical protein
MAWLRLCPVSRLLRRSGFSLLLRMLLRALLWLRGLRSLLSALRRLRGFSLLLSALWLLRGLGLLLGALRLLRGLGLLLRALRLLRGSSLLRCALRSLLRCVLLRLRRSSLLLLLLLALSLRISGSYGAGKQEQSCDCQNFNGLHHMLPRLQLSLTMSSATGSPRRMSSNSYCPSAHGTNTNWPHLVM